MFEILRDVVFSFSESLSQDILLSILSDNNPIMPPNYDVSQTKALANKFTWNISFLRL